MFGTPNGALANPAARYRIHRHRNTLLWSNTEIPLAACITLQSSVGRLASQCAHRICAPGASNPDTANHSFGYTNVRLSNERRTAVAKARQICADEDWWNYWPDGLHMADIIEKRIYNLACAWRNEVQVASNKQT